MQEHTQPGTIEDFIRSDWYRKLKTVVSGYHLTEESEDVVADIVASLFEKDYIGRWDSSKGSFSNWIYTFAANFCKKKWTRSHTQGGMLIERAARIEFYSADEEIAPGTVLEEHISGNCLDIDSHIFKDELTVLLNNRQKEAFSSVIYEEAGFTVSRKDGKNSFVEAEVDASLVGREFKRDLSTMFNLLLEGYNTAEIKDILQTSIQFVQSQFRDIKKLALEAA